MTVFVDTSALYAVLDREDPAHGLAVRALKRLRDADESLLTHAYVEVESVALVHRRLGWPGLDALTDALLPLIEVSYVDEDLHVAARSAMRAARSNVSFVDWVSFTFMSRESVRTAYAFDHDFALQGFTLAR
ncbi:MAG: PIN domain-containing protein [Chloroflexi bacterium]|nr:PIN domain-containing protein [Chloroflexota bacterium]